MTTSRLVSIATGVLSRRLGSELFACNTTDGSFYRLNETGMLVWNGLVAHLSVEHIAATLIEQYGVGHSLAVDAVQSLIDDLLSERLVTVQHKP